MVEIKRLPVRIEPDPSRVITRFFASDQSRTERRIRRVLTLSEEEVQSLLADLRTQYSDRCDFMEETWLEHYYMVHGLVPSDAPSPAKEQRLLIGAYFTMDYAVEAAALFNPSIVPVSDQSGLPDGSKRFIMSLRAVGEGHVSSIVLRQGVIDAHNNIQIDSRPRCYRAVKPQVDAEFDTATLRETLKDLGALGTLERIILDRVGETFSMAEVEDVLEQSRGDARSHAAWQKTRDNLLTLVGSNYRLVIPEGLTLFEAVLFPLAPNESQGIEDLRLVRFTEDDGSETIFGTYTAFNGFAGFPTLLQMQEPGHIECHTMAGKYARNKGMALFPRRIGGNYVMSGRLDGENLYILESDNVLVWSKGRLSAEPKYWWEFSIIGNCGSPLETDQGWLLITHGVGPMRHYCIGAFLLDKDDPAKVIGRLKRPLIVPTGEERVGYVPNVVYTCGSMIHNRSLILPYALSDTITTAAYVDLDELLDQLRRDGP